MVGDSVAPGAGEREQLGGQAAGAGSGLAWLEDCFLAGAAQHYVPLCVGPSPITRAEVPASCPEGVPLASPALWTLVVFILYQGRTLVASHMWSSMGLHSLSGEGRLGIILSPGR